MTTKMTNRKGMTLIEVIVTLAIAGIVIQVLYSIFIAGNKSFEFSQKRGLTQQNVRLATDFIDSELRYIDQLSYEPFEGEYYSIEIKKSQVDDGLYSLEKREYGREHPPEGRPVRTINSKGYISISNKEEGKIISTFNQAGYKPVFKLALENNPRLKSGLAIASDDENKILYYSISGENFNVVTGDSGDSGDSGDPGDGEDTGDAGEVARWERGNNYKLGDQVEYGGKLYQAVKEDQSNLTYHAPGSAKWVYQIWREVSEFWIELNVYYKGDMILYNNKTYVAKQQTQKHKPDQTHWAWEEVSK